MGFLEDANEGRLWPRSVKDPPDQARRLELSFDDAAMLATIRSSLPKRAVALRVRGMFHEETSGSGPSYFPMDAQGRYVPFESEAHEDAVKAAVHARFDMLRCQEERKARASSFGGSAPNLFEARLPAEGEARLTWAFDPELEVKLLEELRDTLGDETVDQLIAEHAAKAKSAQAPPAGPASGGADHLAPEGLSVGQLLGHVVAEVDASAPPGWVEWVMDGGVEPPSPLSRNVRLSCEFWVRTLPDEKLVPFQVKNIVGPLNAVQDLQSQLTKPDGSVWHRIRIRHRAGRSDVDLSFDPPGPPLP